MVTLFLIGHINLEPLELSSDGVKAPSPHEVIQATNEDNPHGPYLPAVLSSPSIQKILYSGAWDAYPIHMGTIRGADHPRIPGVMEVMEGTIRHTDVQPIRHGSKV